MKARHIFLLSVIFFLVFFPVISFADKWGPPSKLEEYSPNREYKLVVIPGSAPSDETDSPQGELYECERNGECSLIWKTTLINDVSPNSAAVSDTGKYVATFDNWGRVGYGNDVVVIYGEGGKLLYRYALEDFLTQQQIREDVMPSVSSRWWQHDNDKAYFIEKKEVLMLPTKAGMKSISLRDGSVKKRER